MYQMPINRPARLIHVVGIDPDKDKSGFAHYDRSLGRFVEYRALRFEALREHCLSFDPAMTEFWVESGWMNKGQNTYQSKNLPNGWALWSPVRREAYKFDRGIDVGVNFGAGFAIIDVLKTHKRTVQNYHPRIAKWNADTLRFYTGITEKLNQDIMDAMRAAFMNK